MTGIRLLALDMDGTTLTSEKTITRETEKWIQKARDIGVMVSFATGRGGPQVYEFADQLQLHSPHVLLNGSLVLDANGETIEQHFLDQALMEPLYQKAAQNNMWCWGFTEKGRRTSVGWNSEWLKESWFKFGFYSNEKSVIETIRGELTTWPNVEVTSSDWNNLEVNPKGVTKASGIKTVCQLLGIQLKDVMAIGDSLNDYPLFKEAGLSIAMDNADPKLKEIATGLTRSNDEDGVAHAIQTHLFNSKEDSF